MTGTLWLDFKNNQTQNIVIWAVDKFSSDGGTLTVSRWPDQIDHYQLSEIEAWGFNMDIKDYE